MPQLNKGGKFVFGLSVINPDLTIHIPPQALLEYDALRDGKVIIFTGSKITGGFCVTTRAFNSPKTRKTSTGRMTPVFFCQIFCFYI